MVSPARNQIALKNDLPIDPIPLPLESDSITAESHEAKNIFDFFDVFILGKGSDFSLDFSNITVFGQKMI